jgi:hypothetical protein
MQFTIKVYDWHGVPSESVERKTSFARQALQRRKLNSSKSVIRILTNADHPIRPYFMSPNKLDKYAMRPRNPQPLFIRTVEYLGETQIKLTSGE